MPSLITVFKGLSSNISCMQLIGIYHMIILSMSFKYYGTVTASVNLNIILHIVLKGFKSETELNPSMSLLESFFLLEIIFCLRERGREEGWYESINCISHIFIVKNILHVLIKRKVYNVIEQSIICYHIWLVWTTKFPRDANLSICFNLALIRLFQRLILCSKYCMIIVNIMCIQTKKINHNGLGINAKIL